MDLVTPSLISFIITCIIIEATPGVNMSYLAILSVTNGRKAGFAATAGVALGLFIVGIATALGVAALIEKSDFIYQGLRISGVFYLLWLAYDTWQTKFLLSEKEIQNLIYHAKFFKRGLVSNLLNPKAVIFYIAILPKFIEPTSSTTAQAIYLTILYVFIATLIHSLIVTLAGTTRVLLEKEKRRIFIRNCMAFALVLIAIWFAITTKQPL
jgi:threonine/homoserine/homoserine lactone efflux protein